jgi:hypothetical protein
VTGEVGVPDFAAATREAVGVLTALRDPESREPNVVLAVELIKRAESHPSHLCAMVVVLAGQLMDALDDEGGDGRADEWLRLCGAAVALISDDPA